MKAAIVHLPATLESLAIEQRQEPAIAVGSRAMQIKMVRYLEKSHIKPAIDPRFPLSQLADAFRYQLSGKHFGKIVIDVIP